MQRAPLQRQLDQGIAALGQDVADDARARLIDYVELLARWNAAYNLTAVRDPAQMITRHLLDSLAIAPYVTGATLADVGSGAGLPGLVLAIVAPERRITLIDTNGKKARFQREAVRSLRLDNVEVIHDRVEQVEGTFECVTARAFASLGDMLTWGGHLLAEGGHWLAMKGRRPDDELDAVPPGFRIEHEHELTVPGLDAERRLLILARTDAA